MKPVYFAEANRRLRELPPAGSADFFPEYTHREGATVTACYRMTWKERLSALWRGRCWLSVKIGDGDLPPIRLEAKESPFLYNQPGTKSVPMVAKDSCKRCHGTGRIGTDKVTGSEILCPCLMPRSEASSKGMKIKDIRTARKDK